MASVVGPAMGGLELTPLGLLAQLAARLLATRPGTVSVTAIAVTTDGERPLAATAVPRMKDSNLARHRGLQSRSPGQPHPACARLKTCLVLPRPFAGGGIPLRPRRLPGSFHSWTAPASIPRLPRTPSTPRAARGMMLPSYGFRFLRILVSGNKEGSPAGTKRPENECDLTLRPDHFTGEAIP